MTAILEIEQLSSLLLKNCAIFGEMGPQWTACPVEDTINDAPPRPEDDLPFYVRADKQQQKLRITIKRNFSF